MRNTYKSRLLVSILCLCILAGLMPRALATEDGPGIISASGVALDKTELTLTVEDTATLTATVSPEDAADKSVTWSVDGSSIAEISGSGSTIKVTAKDTGIAYIEVSTADGSHSAQCVVTVKAKEEPITGSITLSSTSLSLAIGSAATLTPTVSPTDQAIAWTSDKPSVATVSGGVITAVAAGTANITATISVSGQSYTATCKVTVNSPSLSSATASIVVGKTATLSISNLPSTATVAWSSGTTSVATLSSSSGSGVTVTGKAVGTSAVKAVVTYNGSTLITLTCTVTVTASTASDITYSIDTGEAATFTTSKFNSACNSLYGYNLNYVKFTLPSSSYGVLYYNYNASDGSSNQKVSASSQYYYSGSSSKLYLSNVAFVPASGYTGTVTISYSGVDANGNSYTGSVKVTVSGGSSSIKYSINKNEVLTFTASDFNTVCKNSTGANFNYVQFTLPSSSRGVLYYNYNENNGTYDSSVTASKYYYRSSSPYLEDVSFVPASGYTGTVTISFTGVSTGGTGFSGTITITVGANEADISYSATANTPITFVTSDFNTYCKSETSSNLNYVQFTLPSSSRGVLYYNYDEDNGTYDSNVTASKYYYRSSSPYLENVTFVPASGYTGTFTISFTGVSTGGTSFSGTIELTYKAAGSASVIYYSSDGGAVDFNRSDFTSACNARGGGTLSSVKFTLPSSSYGVLYYGYLSSGSYDGRVSASTSYGTGSGTNSIANVSFVPASGYSGTVTITYTGTDSNSDTYTGTIRITVSSSDAQFKDLNGYSWAENAINYLYREDVVTGTSATTYNPAGEITRGDFILMLYRAFDLSSSSTANFSDVPSGMYYADAIAAAKALGIAQGGSDNKFRPAESLTREDAMVLIHRTMTITGQSLGSASLFTLNNFSDGDTVSGYAREAVATLADAGIIQGDGGKIKPKASLTRAEMAVILYRVLEL